MVGPTSRIDCRISAGLILLEADDTNTLRLGPIGMTTQISRTGVPRPTIILVCLMSLLVAGLTACNKNKDAAASDTEKLKKATKTPATQRRRNRNLSRKNLEVKTFDLNEDGKADQRRFINKNGELIRIERDMNFDGKVDLWQYPNAEGDVIEEEMDLDLDGTVDLVAFYEDGTVTRKKMSLDFKEDFAIVKFYDKEGQLLRVERDEDGDGKADVFEYYDDQGNRARVGWDENDDGSPDSFDQLP